MFLFINSLICKTTKLLPLFSKECLSLGKSINLFVMENTNTPVPSFPTTTENKTWEVSGFAIEHLYQAAKWAGFLALVGLTAVTFIILIFSFGTIAALSEMPGMGGASIFGFVMGLIFILFYATPIWWLYKFSTNIKSAIATNDSYKIEEGVNFLRKHYKFIGILTAIVLGLYAFTIIFGVLGGLFAYLVS